MNAAKHDVFVGNILHSTTERDLQEVFSRVGRVINVRIVTEKETGKPKGFAFIEYTDAASALSAIRNLDGVELHGRKLRVSYSNNSSLKDYAKDVGHDAIESTYQPFGAQPVFHTGRTVEATVASLKLHEAYDILNEIKTLAHSDNRKAKELLETHPALINALVEIQKRLGMQTASIPILSVPLQQPPTPVVTVQASRVLAPSVSANVDSFFSSLEASYPSRIPSNQQQRVDPRLTAQPQEDFQRKALIEQVMSLSEDDLLRLPQDKREQMLLLRAQFFSNK